jgi:hypothetical protein
MADMVCGNRAAAFTMCQRGKSEFYFVTGQRLFATSPMLCHQQFPQKH